MIQKSTTQKILEIFFDEPTTKHYLKEISTKIKKAHTSATKVLIHLLKSNLIIKSYEKKGKRKFPFFTSNLEFERFSNMKKIHNLEKLYFSNLVKELTEKLMPKTIVLFGSYSRGEDIEISDIDLFVEAPEENVELAKFEKFLKRKINILFGKINNLEKNLKENILNGIVLEGAIELK